MLQVGRVLQALEDAGRAHDTVVVLTADTGASFVCLSFYLFVWLSVWLPSWL